MRKELRPPISAVSDALNITTVSSPRVNERGEFWIHVSDAIESTGPRAFCAREQTLAYHSPRVRTRGKITPARELLFSTGAHIGEFLVAHFIRNSRWGKYVYANWGCRDWTWAGEQAGEHIRIEDTVANVINKRCTCGRRLDRHFEIDLHLPNLRLTGHPDLVLLHDNIYYVREAKSWERKDIDFDEITVPIASHRLQVSFYYKMLWAKARREGRRVSNKLVVDYIDRSNRKLFGGNPYKSIGIKPEDDKDLEPFKNRLLHAKLGIETGKLPPRICESLTCTRARNCDLAVECFGRKGTHVSRQDASRRTLFGESKENPLQHEVRDSFRLRPPKRRG